MCGAFGVRGELKVESSSDEPDKRFKSGARCVVVGGTRAEVIQPIAGLLFASVIAALAQLNSGGRGTRLSIWRLERQRCVAV